MGKLPTFAAFLALLLLLSGCMQSGIPKSCQGVSQDRLPACTYFSAVTEQNPFICYSIDKTEWRKTCISDSSNPAMAKKISALSEDERNAVFSTAPPGGIPGKIADQKPPEPVQEEETITPAPNQPSNDSNASKDQKIYSQAVSSNDIMLCEQILEMETLKSCLSQVARQTKIPSLCEALSTKDNIDICRTYSQGGDVKG